MTKKEIQKFEEKLKKEKEALEKQLQGFAEKDKNLKGDWDTRFPKFNGESSASGNLEEASWDDAGSFCSWNHFDKG